MNPGNAERKAAALEMLRNAGIDTKQDWYALTAKETEQVLSIANLCRYRTPSHGMRGYGFWQYVNHVRKTATEYVLQGYYSQGWEDLCSADNRKEVRQDKKDYEENERGTYRIITRRVRLDK